MKNIRKIKRWQKIVAAGIFSVFMMADSLVALAYPRVYHVEDKQDDIVATAAVVGEAGRALIDVAESESLVFEVLYDAEFIDTEGTIIPVSPNQPYVFCPGHSWQSGYFQLHIDEDNGGCRVEIYNCKYCSICDTIKIVGWYATYNYAKCPH